MPGPVIGRQLAQTGDASLPAVDLGGQRGGVCAVGGDGELPVLGGGARAGHLADAAAEGLCPGLLIRAADAGLPLVRRHRLGYLEERNAVAITKKIRRMEWARPVVFGQVKSAVVSF